MTMTQDERGSLLSQLELYRQSWGQGRFNYRGYLRDEELLRLERLENFVVATPCCFARSSLEGHITGSALVTDASLTQVLLTHHRKLGKWLQLGGHAEGDTKPDQIALREACEESGLSDLKLLRYELDFAPSASEPTPFDLDIHLIPARKEVPAHYHYDIRFLILADASHPILCSEESNDLKWINLTEAYRFTEERSMHRQFNKLAFLREARGHAPFVKALV